ncbi:helicase HerA-like domain-containing protein [Timonella sp. A28]|uniref:helicase HerA-like domain-containing protein n=1 Tax=Timonella sp. A28 TaxID=3442640 RepID=UPI003EBB840D
MGFDGAVPTAERLAQLRAQAAQAKAEAAEAKALAAQAALEAAEAATQTRAHNVSAHVVSSPGGVAATVPISYRPTSSETPTPTTPPVPPPPPAPHVPPAPAHHPAQQLLPFGTHMTQTKPSPHTANNPTLIGFDAQSMNQHGLISGSSGTGKTRTVQVISEALSFAGVPVFIADTTGDASGLALPADTHSPNTTHSAHTPNFPVEFYSIGGTSVGVPIRSTVCDFGPILLTRALGLTAEHEHGLDAVFKWADKNGLPLLDLKDVVAVIHQLTSPDRRTPAQYFGLADVPSADVLLRAIESLRAQGGEQFFGEPSFDTKDVVRQSGQRNALISILELSSVHFLPNLYSAFFLWLIADACQTLPRTRQHTRPTAVFFFDEAEFAFSHASPRFIKQVVATLEKARMHGILVFFVSSSPHNLPVEVAAQLRHHIHHGVRGSFDSDAHIRFVSRALPTFPYDVGALLQTLPRGHAVVSISDSSGIVTPGVWTKVRMPQTSIGSAPPSFIEHHVRSSPGYQRYGTSVDNYSAHEMLAARIAQEQATQQQRLYQDTSKDDLIREAKQVYKSLASTKKKKSKKKNMKQRFDGEFEALLKIAGSHVSKEITRTFLGTRQHK